MLGAGVNPGEEQMPETGSRAGAIVRSALRIYLITAGIMFLFGTAGGALLAMGGYALPNPF
jgi:hypothetical protein